MSTTPPWNDPNSSPPFNPYTAPQGRLADAGAASIAPPTFTKVMVIIDLVFTSLRLMLVLLGIVGYVQIKQAGDDAMLRAAAFELGTGAGIVLFGIPANVLVLLRKPWAVVLGYISALFTLGSIAVGVWQLSIVAGQQFEPGSPQMMGAMIGGGCVGVVRLILVVTYVAALTIYSRDVRQTAVPGWSQ